MGKTHITAEPGLPFIEITREFDAPRELLFQAHADPSLLVQWMGPRRLTMIVEEWDMRDGGRWRYMQRDDDGVEYGFHGVFHGPQTPEASVQTFEFEGAPGHVALNTLTLQDRGDRTLLRVQVVHQSVQARDATIEGGMESGMDEGYGRLDELIARLVPVT
jgi:uncharacterized protein YndB with AHSA1/START domain